MDVRTLFIAVAVACFTEVLTIVVVWATNRRIAGMGCWTFGTVLAALSMPLFLFQGHLDSKVFTYVLPNLLFQGAMVSLCIGACRFVRKRPPVGLLIGGSGVVLALLVWFTFGHEDLAWRVRLASGWAAVVFLMTAMVLWRHGGRGLTVSTRLTSIGFFIAFVMMIYRTAIWIGDGPSGWISGNAWQSSMLALVSMTMSYTWIFCILYMVSQFRTREVAVRMEEKYAVEQQLLAAKHQLERERFLRLRQTVARDLHDGIGGITAAVATLAGLGRSDGDDDRAGILAMIEDMATMGSREIRELMGAVESDVLRWEDWLGDIEIYARRITEAMNIELFWDLDGEIPASHSDARSAASLMKVVFEALHNLVKHASARTAWLSIRFSPDSLGITIRDDGRGFESERLGGRGIDNMRTRIAELGGMFSHDGSDGTHVRFEIPLPLGSIEPTIRPSLGLRTKKKDTHDFGNPETQSASLTR